MTEPEAALAANPSPASAPPAPDGGRNNLTTSPPSGAPDPNLALFMAAARDPLVDVEKLKQLMALRKEVEADVRKRAFLDALARAKGEFTPIIKRRVVDYEHRDEQGRTQYKHEDLADIAAIVDPILSKFGLSYRHRSSQEGGKVKVTCILSHADGHSEENSLEAPEDKSGKKNPIQAIASTVSYLARYSLKEALGIAAGRGDDDGKGFDNPDAAVVGLEQIMLIEQQIRDTESDLAMFLKTLGAETLQAMTVGQFKRGKALLAEKRRRAVASIVDRVKREATRDDERGRAE